MLLKRAHQRHKRRWLPARLDNARTVRQIVSLHDLRQRLYPPVPRLVARSFRGIEVVQRAIARNDQGSQHALKVISTPSGGQARIIEVPSDEVVRIGTHRLLLLLLLLSG